MSHPIVHIELSANNHEEAAKFYTAVFDWQIQSFPEMNYTTFTSGEGGPGGGFNNVSDEYPAGQVVIYINTDNIEASMEKVEANGGQRVSPDIDIPGVGTMAMFKDPTGNTLSLLKPAEM
ncbi:MAG: VOC family protein [Ardenticatenaceae bacterium]|nr:VOC family protein [Anaerolineales bacterium]MCB8921800.1 VOC family protein [Ardenticatenaceae bacterium]